MNLIRGPVSLKIVMWEEPKLLPPLTLILKYPFRYLIPDITIPFTKYRWPTIKMMINGIVTSVLAAMIRCHCSPRRAL